MRKFKFNYTVFKNWSCTKFATGEDEAEAKKKLFDVLMSEPFENKPLKKKDIVIDSVEEMNVKKSKKNNI